MALFVRILPQCPGGETEYVNVSSMLSSAFFAASLNCMAFSSSVTVPAAVAFPTCGVGKSLPLPDKKQTLPSDQAGLFCLREGECSGSAGLGILILHKVCLYPLPLLSRSSFVLQWQLHFNTI